MISVRRDRRQSQAGFALLLIFAFAAAVAIGIYREMPRAVFESARAKEELLVERGEQYQLAIRRYYAKTKGYPQTIEQLEETNGVRFLRQRYRDPMTGKDEWRLVHIGPGGYTDSKVFKPQNATEKKQVYESSITQGYSVGQAPATANEAGMQGVAMRQRPGDQIRPGQELPDPQSPEDAGAQQPPADATVGAARPPLGPLGPDAEDQQPNSGTTGNANQTPTSQPAQAPPPPPGSFTPSTLPPGVGPTTSFGGAQTLPGGQPAGPANPALQQISSQLTSGRPMPGGGAQPGSVPTGPTGTQQGAAGLSGIAGVASKYEGEGIKRIHDRSRIDEWEFLFDASKQTAQNQAGQQGQGQGQAPGQNAGAAGAASGSPNRQAPPSSGGATSFGGSSSFGGSTSFGPIQAPTGQPRPPGPRPPGTPPGMGGGMGSPGMGNRPRP